MGSHNTQLGRTSVTRAMERTYFYFLCLLSLPPVFCINCYVCRESCDSVETRSCDEDSRSCMTTTEVANNVTIVTQRSCWTSTEATCVPGRRGERVCSCLSDLCNLHSVLASLRNSSKQCGAHTGNVLLDNVLICLLYLYCNKVL